MAQKIFVQSAKVVLSKNTVFNHLKFLRSLVGGKEMINFTVAISASIGSIM